MEQDSLFSNTSSEKPLADRQRPSSFAQIVGQDHFLNEKFYRLIESDKWTGLVFWGPPGTGKTTLAHVVAKVTKRPFVSFSAVRHGVKDFRKAMDASCDAVGMGMAAHILFIDEVHRLNKAQQDVLLPYLETGNVRFIGATTENPSFELNNAVSSRCMIFNFKALNHAQIISLLSRAVPSSKKVSAEVLEHIASVCFGDARKALGLLENLLLSCEGDEIGLGDFEHLKEAQTLYYDKKSEAHYDTISAFIKSVRGSDPDAALYYLARMLEGGEDPLFIARRLVILASEDIGNANPQGLVLATQGFTATHSIGLPEARIILAQVTTYLACSEKSNRAYEGIEKALGEVRRSGNLDIPMSIRNAPTKMMKEWGYGAGYDYPHKHPGATVQAQYLPDKIKGKRFYEPSNRGPEGRFSEQLKRRTSSPPSHTNPQ